MTKISLCAIIEIHTCHCLKKKLQINRCSFPSSFHLHVVECRKPLGFALVLRYNAL